MPSDGLAPGEVQDIVLQTFQEHFPHASVQLDDDFYSLGGHSLLAVRLAGRLQSRGIAIELGDILGEPKVRALIDLAVTRLKVGTGQRAG